MARRSKSSTPLVGSDELVRKQSPLVREGIALDPPHHNDSTTTPWGTPRADASFRDGDKVSPMLAKLRMTPGSLLKEKQSILVRKHEETKRKVDTLNVGGGVSLWPEMDSMRLTTQDIRFLAIQCVLLVVVTVTVFVMLHGLTISELMKFHRRLSMFADKHVIHVNSGQDHFDQSLINWHSEYKQIVDEIHSAFDINKLPTTYMLYICVYIFTLGVLFYYLIDNMFARSKLSPKRIKRWVSLLVFTTVWTCLLGISLLVALQTEAMIELNIHSLSNTLAEVIPTNLSFDKFNMVLQYWRTRCLPPTTHGTISIFGILPVRDVTFYLQYYSIPIGTVLLTPVFRLIVSLLKIYNVKED